MAAIISSNPHNPFRSRQAQHPQSSSANSDVQASTPDAAQARDASLLAELTEDVPPAYTPIADLHQGEAAVEFGPRRPFQAPPPRPAVNLPVSGNGFYEAGGGAPVNTNTTGWQEYPGAQAPGLSPGRPAPPRHPSTASASAAASSRTYAPPSGLPPPPRHPSQTQRRSSPPPRPPPSQVAPTPRPRSTPPSDAQPQYLPPPGQPPRRSVSSASKPYGSGGSQAVPDDGRPTTTPMPGHPLLKEGKMLVYPPGFECNKCHNIGYKNNDPSHPCRRCWDKYARPYAGALAYAPTSASPAATSGFQRPLPTFRPPQAPRPHSMVEGYPGAAHREQCQARDPGLRPPPPQQPPPPQRLRPPQQPFFAPQRPLQPNLQLASHPPPGATVLNPGDPRIGGNLCWRCNGRGTVSFLIFDEEMCGVCSGMGRVFN